MAILNLTSDSFSGDGLLANLQTNRIINVAQKLVKDGADIIDIGAESSRPGAKPISIKEELRRTVPIIKVLAKKIKVPISIDTYKAEVAEQALDSGASIVNDISALSDLKMPKVIKKYKSAVVLMHMQGNPLNMQDNPRYKSLIPEIINYLRKKIKIAVDSGISWDKIMVDPGFGFGKTLEHNIRILKRLREFEVLGLPILAGPSRKSFIGKIISKDVGERIFGTAAAVSLAIANGAHIIRVHDVKAMADVVKVTDAIMQCETQEKD